MTKRTRWVQPENWTSILHYANALKRFAETRNPDEFTKFQEISHTDMAEALIAIANGADAKAVFRQTGQSGRQSRRLHDRTRAVVYWKTIAKGGTRKNALDAAKSHFKEYVPVPSDESLARIARLHSDYAFAVLEEMGVDVTVLRQQSKAKARRGRWE